MLNLSFITNEQIKKSTIYNKKKMKKYIFSIIAVTVFSLLSFGQVGVNTQEPTEILDVNGTMRVRDLPENGETNAIYTQPNGERSENKDQTFTATRTVVADNNGVLGYIEGLNNGGGNYNFSQYMDLYGDNSTEQTVAVSSTIDINGLNNIEITLEPDEEKLIIFDFTGYVRAMENTSNVAGQGAFALWNVTDNVKVTSVYTSFYSNPSFYSIPVPSGFSKAITLSNSTSSAKTWTFKMSYKAWATAGASGSGAQHIINFEQPGYTSPENDIEAVRNRLLITIFNM